MVPEEIAKAEYRKGKKSLAQKDSQAAISYFSRCIEHTPQRAECHWELGWAYFLEHDFDRAKTEWLAVKQLSPKKAALPKALEKIEAHLAYREKAHSLRTAQIKSFRSHRRPTSETVKIHAVGDVMLGTDYPRSFLPPAFFSPLTAAAALLRGSDITFANYEGTLCE